MSMKNTQEIEKMKIALQHLNYFTLVLAHTCRNSSITTWEIKYKLERFNDFTSNFLDDEKRIDNFLKMN